MSKNELSTASSLSDYPMLDSSSEVGAIIAANAELGVGGSIEMQDLPVIKIPAGGSTTWVWTDAEGVEQSSKTIEGILVYTGVRGILWPTTGPSNSKPVIVSNDLKTGLIVSDDYGDLDPDVIEAHRTGERTVNWRTLPYCQWDSGPGGRGKRCKEIRLLGILQPGEAIPVIIQGSPASNKPIDTFLRKIGLKSLFYQRIVKVTLTKVENPSGQPYGQIACQATGDIGPEAAARVREMFTDPLTAANSTASTQEPAPF